MKTFRIARLLVLATCGAAALSLPACGEGIERTTQGSAPRSRLQQQVDDAELKSRVNAALTADGHLQANAITVTVKKGEVTLAGAVPVEQIARADEVARRIDGVAVVINALRGAATPAPQTESELPGRAGRPSFASVRIFNQQETRTSP